MSDIRIGIAQMGEPEKGLYEALIEFYDTMKDLEKEPAEHKGGKQATKIVMTASDIEAIFKQHYVHCENISISPIVPSEFRIIEKSKEFESNNHINKFAAGAMWMKLMLIEK